MEKERQIENLSLEEFLGSTRQSDEMEIGIINETKHWIHRRALDYLMVGFVTDVDQVESSRDLRYEAYLATIQDDLDCYTRDLQKWNIEHLQNAIPSKWQTDYYSDDRRQDLPSVKVCEKAIVFGPATERSPTREELESFAAEGVDIYFDDALTLSEEILNAQAVAITNELPIAPVEYVEDGVKTQFTLATELKHIQSRLNAVKELSDSRTNAELEIVSNFSASVSDLSGYDFEPTVADRHSITDELREIIKPFRRVGGAVLQLVNTGQIIIKKIAP